MPPVLPVLQVCITIADGASYLAGCAKDFKTIAEASRITAEWMPRATAPCAPGDHDETGLCRISCSGAGIRPKPNGRVRHPASFDNPPT